MYGRDVLLLAQRPGEREGVKIVMLTSPTANSQVDLAAGSRLGGRAAEAAEDVYARLARGMHANAPTAGE